MSIDLSQFHQVFFEESFEGLDIMENGLLALAPGSEAVDDVNTIFRAAHSIKGGAGTFGFQMVSDFTHVVETLLDEYRSSTRPISQAGIDILLESVDVLRAILSDLQAESDVDMTEADALKARFETLLASSDESSASTDSVSSAEDAVASAETEATPTEAEAAEPESAAPENSEPLEHGYWHIVFKPSTDIVQTGNEPYRIFRELSDLGDVDVEAFTDALPEFSSSDPEEIYLYWNLILHSDCEKLKVTEVFEWVVDDSEIIITRVEDANDVHVPRDVVSESTDDAQSDTADEAGAEAEAIQSTAPVDEAPKQPQQPVQAQPKSAPAEKQPAKAARPVSNENQSIRVGIDKIDSLINLVGELVITQSMLGQIGDNFSIEKLQRLREGLVQLEQNTREMQESVMRIRMVPISFTFSRFPRLVRDISKKLEKQIELELLGENTELDKTVMEKIGDPLVHMVRNSMDHGIESPEERVAKGKPAEGKLTLNAYHQGGYIVIEIKDDGKGIDPQAIRAKAIQNGLLSENETLSDQQLQELIFHPGLSTAEEVSDLSGRGVGMDVVKRNIQELKGTVELTSVVGEGSTFRIKLPLTLSILDGQLVQVGEETYVLPLTSIIESIQVTPDQLNSVAGQTDVIVLRDEYVPVVRLYEVFNIEPVNSSIFEGLVVVVESGNQKIGLHVDDLLSQQQVVIKSLDTNYKRIDGLSGATILGDGTVALIVDIDGIVTMVGSGALASANMIKTAS